MPLIDERGRLFGKLNVIDGLVAALVLFGLIAAGAGLLTSRRPPDPIVGEVTPKTLTAGSDLRIRLLGDHFAPYLRVFLQRADQTAEFVRPTQDGESEDAFTLANAATATFLVESPRLAEVRLPEGLTPGTYDLVLYNETEQVRVVRNAFTILAPPPAAAPPPADRVTIRAMGAFTGLAPDTSLPLRRGMPLQGTDGTTAAEVLEFGAPRPDVARVRTGNEHVLAPVAEKQRVPATLRVSCAYLNGACHVGGTAVEPGARLSLRVADALVIFDVESVRSDLETTREARALVRFTVRPEIAPLMKVGEVSHSVPMAGPARVLEIRERREVAAQNTMALSDLHFQTYSVPDRVVVIDALVSIPVVSSGSGWHYRNEPVRAGASLNFETPTYLMRGWILGVTFHDARNP